MIKRKIIKKKFKTRSEIQNKILYDAPLKEILRDVKRNDLEKGKKYILTITEFDETIAIMQRLFKEIFTSTANKFFKIDKERIDQVIGMRI